MSNPNITTLGCCLNADDSEAMRALVLTPGLDEVDTFKRVSLISVRDHRLVGATIS
jgi:tRNA A37 methylthiotransferase MiaB